MNNICKNAIVAGLIFILPIVARAAPDLLPATAGYRESGADTPNPDRGMFRQIRIDNSLQIAPLAPDNKNYRIYFVLGRFINSVIPDEELKHLDQSLSMVERARQRLVVRFIYDYPSDETVKMGLIVQGARSASPSMMSTHIRQLAEVIRRHPKALFAVESGLIGFWGEQHGDAPDKQTPDVISALVDQWRAELAGTEIQVLARYPKALREHVRRTPDLLRQQPKLGFWNDCLGAYDDANMGSAEVTVVEGETCALYPRVDYSCATMTSFFKKIQLELLHSRYFRPTIDGWEKEGCLDDIQRHLGYRYVIREAKLTAGGSRLELQIDNVGWGASLVSRPLYLVSNGRRVKEIADLEKFGPGSVNRIRVELDPSVAWSTAKLSLETDDQVRFSNTTGNLLFVPPSTH